MVQGHSSFINFYFPRAWGGRLSGPWSAVILPHWQIRAFKPLKMILCVHSGPWTAGPLAPTELWGVCEGFLGKTRFWMSIF